MRNRVLPPTYFLVCLVCEIGLHFAFPIRKIVAFPYSLVGIPLIILGGGLNVWADALFKKHGTTVKPHESPTALVTSGPFRLSRHPMYLGMLAILLGDAVLLGSVVTFVFPIVFVILMEAIFIPLEERDLEEIFGERYLDYWKKVRRWI
ncbi:MAG: isoprenylcysteine carboxylmethyltransferase family protein [bacterium]|nr:isoprenylcysteine carboxylmethyltransferase family protein [bacterium]